MVDLDAVAYTEAQYLELLKERQPLISKKLYSRLGGEPFTRDDQVRLTRILWALDRYEAALDRLRDPFKAANE